MRKTLVLVVLAFVAGLVGPSCCAVQASGPATISSEHPLPWNWDTEVFETAVHALEARCPLNGSAMVMVGPIPGHFWGLTWWDGGQYVIMIDSRQPMHAIVATLEHEWAHAMVWDASQRPEDDGHGPLWGVAQARCYRAVLAALERLGAERAAEADCEPEDEPEAVEDGWEAVLGKVPGCSH